MVSTISIRSAVSIEATLLSQLAMRKKAHWGYSSDLMRSCKAELTYLASDIEDDNIEFYVAEIDTAVVGFYCTRRMQADEYELDALFVEPEQIGSGIGKRLVQHAIETVRQNNGQSLVIQGDPHAEDFYVAAGGELIGTRESESVPGRFLPLFRIELR